MFSVWQVCNKRINGTAYRTAFFLLFILYSDKWQIKKSDNVVLSYNPNSAAGSTPPNSKHLTLNVYILLQPSKTADNLFLKKMASISIYLNFLLHLLGVFIQDKTQVFLTEGDFSINFTEALQVCIA